MLVAAGAASSKTDEPTVVLDVGDLLGITDHFVITSGSNLRQVRTIAEEIEMRVKAQGGGSPRYVKGSTTPAGCCSTMASSSCTCSWTRRATLQPRAPLVRRPALDQPRPEAERVGVEL